MEVYQYQIGGSLASDDPSYIVRSSDAELYEALKRGEFCYVLNCRQIGKSSILVRTMHRLQEEGYKCTAVDMTRIGSENITAEQWYKGIVADLWRGFKLFGKLDLKAWWREAGDVSLLQQLSNFIEELLLGKFPQDNLVIFIDEIDSILSLNFGVDDFFALIRYCYNQRAINGEYNRLTFAIFGVATPSDLIADKNRTPFNIGRAIGLHGFSLDEVEPLAKGLENLASHPKVVMREILARTGGQPFLTQKLCQILRTMLQVRLAEGEGRSEALIQPGTEEFWVKFAVQKHIIDYWESQDEPEHLRTIRDRLLRDSQRAGRLLGIYQHILQGEKVAADDSREQAELLLSGLVVKEQGVLQVRNTIYREVFHLKWVETQLASLRPYSQALDAWMTSGQEDTSRLLRGQALRDAQTWAQGKSLSDLDYHFLAASVERDRHEVQNALEVARLEEVEVRLVVERKSARRQKIFSAGMSLAFAIACGLAIGNYVQYRQVQLSEIKAIALSSEALLASNKRFDALLQAMKAQQRLQTLGGEHADMQAEINKMFRKTVYELTEVNRLSGDSSAMLGVAISPNGQTLATANADGSVKLWKRDGTLLMTLDRHPSSRFNLQFSPDGRTLATANQDKTITLLKLDGAANPGAVPLRTLKGHQAPVWNIAFSPDSQTIASVSGDSTVKLWKLDGTLLRTLKGHTAVVWGIAFSPDGQTLASSSSDGTVKLWKLDGTQLATFKGHSGSVVAVAFSPDGRTLATGSVDSTVKLWKLDGTELATLKGHSAAVWAVAFNPDGKTLASASADSTVKLWKLDGSELMTLKGHGASVMDVAFSSDGQTLATASTDNTVKLWQPQTAFLRTLKNHTAAIWAVAFSRDGKTLATGSGDGSVKLWKRDGSLLATLKEGSGGVASVAFSPDGAIIASGYEDKTVKLWRRDGRLLATLKGHGAGVVALAFSPDGKTFLSGSGDGSAKLWRRDGTEIRTFKGHGGSVRDVAFSPDGKTIATASVDNTVKLWKVDGTELATLKGHQAGVWGVQFSPDGKTIASASLDQSVKLWKTNGTLLRTLEGSASFLKVAFSPDGKIVASGSWDGSVKLWKRDGSELTTLYGHGGVVWGIAFSSDGKTLASSSDDQTAILWDWQRIAQLDFIKYSCDRLRDYLRTNRQVEEGDRHLCEAIGR